jgi:predicted ATP-dependent serine protease
MSKLKTSYVCQACGASSPKWQGQCSGCQAWNTLEETRQSSAEAENHRFAPVAGAARIQRLSDVEAREIPRLPTGIGEFDRVLGGGLVSGAVVLIGGDPGIGKSTLLLQALAAMSEQQRVLYVTGEESAEQVALSDIPAHEVREALAARPETHQVAIYLADVEGFSYREIATIMDTPIGTVMSRLSRGRNALRQALSQYAVEQRLAAHIQPPNAGDTHE